VHVAFAHRRLDADFTARRPLHASSSGFGMSAYRQKAGKYAAPPSRVKVCQFLT